MEGQFHKTLKLILNIKINFNPIKITVFKVILELLRSKNIV